MKCRLITIWAGWLVGACLFGCVSKAQFEAVNNDYQLAQTALHESTQASDQCKQDMKALQNQVQTNHDEIRMLSQRIETQNQTVRKKESVIALKRTFIRLFDDSKQTLQTSIDEQIAAKELNTPPPPPPVKVVLVNKLLFESGSARLSEEGKRLLSKLTGLMQDEQYPSVLVQGHTDDRPLKSTARYASNWDLSVARATSVVEFLHETVGVEPERLSATGFGPYRPLASNDTEEGRRQNRRIEIIIEATGE